MIPATVPNQYPKVNDGEDHDLHEGRTSRNINLNTHQYEKPIQTRIKMKVIGGMKTAVR